MDAVFVPAAIASLGAEARAERLRSLEATLAGLLPKESSRREFFERSHGLVEELRALGHDLWSFDSDGDDFETWCGDWTRTGSGPMTVTFRYPRRVEVSWREGPLSAD
jgi:hypothetical protein